MEKAKPYVFLLSPILFSSFSIESLCQCDGYVTSYSHTRNKSFPYNTEDEIKTPWLPQQTPMLFAPSPTSVNSNFFLSDSDMPDDYIQTAPNEKGFPSRPVLEKEGSLNGSMITIIVSLQKMLAVHRFFFTRYSLLQVDDIHFRLDSHFLQSESETLKDIITSSDSDTIHLKNVSAAEFRALWRFFYEG